MKIDDTITQDELRSEYDLRKLRVRKFGPARKQFRDFVKLAPDVAVVFPDSTSVNEALTRLIQDSQKNGNTHSCLLPMKPIDPMSTQHDAPIVKLAPDVADAFLDAASVNEALRSLIRVTKKNNKSELLKS